MDSKVIGFRADGSNTVGVGHIMRSLTIADAFNDKLNTLFITDSRESASIIEGRGFRALVLHADSMENELPELTSIIVENRIDFLMVDSYRVTDEYLSALGESVKLGYIDDFTDHRRPVDLILNYNIFVDEDKVKSIYEGSKTKLLLGSTYAPIRKEFGDTSYEVRDEVKNVLILTGGGDRYGLADKFAKRFEKSEDGITYHLVGGFYTCKSEESEGKNVVWHGSVSDIWNLMQKCDVAISAGGSTVYELMSIGVPVISYTFADNQKPLAAYIDKNKIFPTCGDYRDKGETLISDIAGGLAKLKDKGVRESLCAKEKALVGAEGASLIAKAISEI